MPRLPPAASRSWRRFRQELGELGYVEGRNLALELRFADGKLERLPVLARELVRLNPDVILVSTTPGSLAAKAATATIPIVFVAVADPVGAGLVRNLARPGGNVTGITHIVAELTGKRLELLKEIVPSASRIAVLVNPDDPNATAQLQNAKSAARTLGVQLDPVLPVRGASDLERAFEAISRCRRRFADGGPDHRTAASQDGGARREVPRARDVRLPGGCGGRRPGSVRGKSVRAVPTGRDIRPQDPPRRSA